MKLTDEAKKVLEEYKPIIERWQKNKSLALTHPQKLKFEAVHIELGFGFVNKSCQACLSKMMSNIINGLEKLESVDYTKLKYFELLKTAKAKGYTGKSKKKRDLISYLNNI